MDTGMLFNIALCVCVALLIAVIFCLLEMIKNDMKERKTAGMIARLLPDDKAGLFSDVTVLMPRGRTTQIDHVLVTTHGLYVIEEKNYVGTLIGDINEKKWLKFRHKNRLQLNNPFRQNEAHIHGIRHIMEDPELECVNVVLINGPCKFKGDKPEWLCMGMKEMEDSIKRRQDMSIIHPEKVTFIRNQIISRRLTPGLITDLTHINSLNKRFNQSMKLTYLVTFMFVKIYGRILNYLGGTKTKYR